MTQTDGPGDASSPSREASSIGEPTYAGGWWTAEDDLRRDEYEDASRDDLGAEQYRQLSRDCTEVTAMTLASNYAVPADVLDRLIERFPAMRDLCAGNPSASVELKDTMPLGWQGQQGIDRYLVDRDATPEERALVRALHAATPQPGGPLLGEVWLQARPQPPT